MRTSSRGGKRPPFSSAGSGVAAALCLTALLLIGCDRSDDSSTKLLFWAMGREGEVVQELVRGFEADNPDLRVEVQQIPWSAAHEKLLTAHVGRSTPDIAQLGNTWIAEFVALRALEPLDSLLGRSEWIDPDSYFTGIWNTNVIEDLVYGIPWYVDTRVLFYRKDILREAGYSEMPRTWSEWRAAMQSIKGNVGADRFAIFLPANEPTQAVILGLQSGSKLLAEADTRGVFSEPEFERGFDFYLGLYRDGLAPPVGNTEIANLYQEFERGYFAMYITGPWNLGEFRRRISLSPGKDWSTASLPGPEGEEDGVSLAGGASLVLFRESRKKEAAWRLVEYLSKPEIQQEFYRLSGDLPSRVDGWEGEALLGDPLARAFFEQLQRVLPAPKIPEWEQILSRITVHAEAAIRGALSPKEALDALDRDVDEILEKRRWLMEQRTGGESGGKGKGL